MRPRNRFPRHIFRASEGYSVDWLQVFEVALQRFLLFDRQRQKFKTVVVSAAIAEHSAQIPGPDAGQFELQVRHLSYVQLGRQEYADSGFGQITAMPFQLLVPVSEKYGEVDSKIASESRMPPAPPVGLRGCSFWSRGGHVSFDGG